MRSRLWIKVYVAFVAMLLGLVLLVGLAAHTMRGDVGPVPPPAMAAAELFLDGLPEGEDFQPELARRARKLEIDVALWTPDAQLIATTGNTPAAPDPAGPSHGWRGGSERGCMFMKLSDGRWLAVTFLKDHFQFRLRRFLAVLLLIALAVAAMSVPVARGVTRRLGKLREGVDRFGAGDLSARAPVRGSDEIADLAVAFNRSADRIEELVATQRRMLASASHELRSPLARVRMALELVRESVGADKASYVDDAVGDVEELDALVGDLLAAVRTEATGGGRRQDVDVAAILAAEGDRLGVPVPDSPSLVVSADPGLLRVLIRNLLSNAVGHGGDAASVEVSLSGGDDGGGDGGGIELVVADRGPGVPEAERERIFEPFYRPEGHREGADGGVGLGLSLARQIARAHGGDVRCEDRPGGGARFVVVLPSR